MAAQGNRADGQVAVAALRVVGQGAEALASVCVDDFLPAAFFQKHQIPLLDGGEHSFLQAVGVMGKLLLLGSEQQLLVILLHVFLGRVQKVVVQIFRF